MGKLILLNLVLHTSNWLVVVGSYDMFKLRVEVGGRVSSSLVIVNPLQKDTVDDRGKELVFTSKVVGHSASFKGLDVLELSVERVTA